MLAIVPAQANLDSQQPLLSPSDYELCGFLDVVINLHALIEDDQHSGALASADAKKYDIADTRMGAKISSELQSVAKAVKVGARLVDVSGDRDLHVIGIDRNLGELLALSHEANQVLVDHENSELAAVGQVNQSFIERLQDQYERIMSA